MKNLKWISIIMIAWTILFWNSDFLRLYNKGNYKFVFEADKDDAYENLLYVKKIKGEKELNKLIFLFLRNENGDLLSKEVSIRYIRENRKIEYLNTLITVQKNFENINPDSIWDIKIEPNKFRSNKLKNAQIVSTLNQTINELKSD